MVNNLIAKARQSAQHTAGTAAISMVSALLVLVGLAFWTAAGFFLLLTITTVTNALLLMGAFYTGAGLIGFGVASSRGRKPIVPEVKETPAPNVENLIDAFAKGMRAGQRTRS